MMSQARRGVARLGAAAALSAAISSRGNLSENTVPMRGLSGSCQNSEVSYYGSYLNDRFGGGIGRRVGVDESGKRPLKGTGVVRVATFNDTHENLRKWATKENWQRATEIHKGAYFTRYTNEIQEAVLEHVRQHYEKMPYKADEPVVMALYRFGDRNEFEDRLNKMRVTKLPAVVHGGFDEKNERCIVDFANKRLGGGWLSYGCVQEEIMFIERPDFGAMCARSLLEMPDPRQEPIASPFSMEANEVWILKGAPRYAHLGWYGRPPKDALKKVKLLNPEEDRKTSPTVIAMDAIKASFETYQKEHLELMLIKAYTGFVAAKEDDVAGEVVATGSWGCGAFYNGEPVMFAIQSLAANAAGVALTYHVLGDGRRLAPAFELLEEALVKKLSIKEALELLAERCANDPAFRTKFKPRSAMWEMWAISCVRNAAAWDSVTWIGCGPIRPETPGWEGVWWRAEGEKLDGAGKIRTEPVPRHETGTADRRVFRAFESWVFDMFWPSMLPHMEAFSVFGLFKNSGCFKFALGLPRKYPNASFMGGNLNPLKRPWQVLTVWEKWPKNAQVIALPNMALQGVIIGARGVNHRRLQALVDISTSWISW